MPRRRETYRSRNRAIAALVRSSDNVVVTNTIDSAGAVETLVDSAYVLARAGGAGLDSAQILAITNNSIDSDYINALKFVSGDAERRLNITSAAPTGPQQVSTGDFWLDRDDLNLYRLTADGNWTSSLPAGTFSAESGLTSFNVFQNGGGSNGNFNIGSSHTPPGPNGAFSSTFTISTSPYNSGGRWTFANPVNFSYYYMGNSDAGHLWSIGYTDGSYMVANGGLGGSKTNTPSSYTWYDAQGNSLGKTINQGQSGGHTHDVRHPNGVLATYIIHGRNNYGTRNYDAWMFFSGANDWVRVGEIYDSGDIKSLIDSAYINARVNIFDSATVTNLVDSAYIQLRDRFQEDSNFVTNIVDTSYIQARQLLVDSNAIINLVDSAYVQARQSNVGGGGGVDSAATITLINSVIDSSTRAFTYTYTASASQTTFSGPDNNSNTLAYSTGNIMTFLNGILLVDSDDYVASTGNSIVLNSAASLNDILNVVKFRSAGSGGNLSHQQYKYTVSSPTTTFSGNDDNGNSLSYETGELQVFLNGILLIDSADYTATNQTSVILGVATDSGDTIVISTFRGSRTTLDSADVLAIAGGAGGGTDSATVIALSGELKGGMFRINPQSLSINTTIDSNENAHVAGPISFDSGVVLTINGNLVIS